MEVIRKEAGVRPEPADIASEQRLGGDECDEGIVKRPDAQTAPQQEAPNLDAAGTVDLFPQLGADQEAA